MRRAKAVAARITRFEILATLQETRPPIWRRLLVPADMRLDHFHQALQISFGWKDSHLHQFKLGGIRFQIPDPDEPGDINEVDERNVTLGQVLQREGAIIEYIYDFGDAWKHALLLEKIIAAGQIGPAACLGGERACPPEDSGGATGYARLLAVLSNPKHPEHDELRRWAGRRFSPESFDLDAINKRLKKFQ